MRFGILPTSDLEVPEHVVVESVHLSDSLMQLSYNIANRKKEES